MPKMIDLSTQLFGRLTVIRLHERKNPSDSVKWECVCECGETKIVSTSDLRSGSIKSCGCLRREGIDLTNCVFGRLTAKERVGKNKHGTYLWRCVCECGGEVVVSTSNLTTGHTQSCKCLHDDLIRNKGGRNRLPNGQAHRNTLYAQYKRGAVRRNLVFELTLEQFECLTKEQCYYCGKEPQERFSLVRFRNGSYVGNGIDRKDNNTGYILSNCVPCCETCNRAKLATSYEEFIAWIKQVHNNLNL